jgi:thiol-disulfide isomerase/thioredoxin
MIRKIGWFALVSTLVLGWMAPTDGQAQPTKKNAGKKRRGFKFPPIKVPYVHYEGKAKMAKKVYNFTKLIGKKPFVMFYFLPTHKASLTELKAYAAASKIFGNKIQFFAATKATNVDEAKAAFNKMKELNIRLPVLLDEKGLVAYVMLTRRVPAYAMVTKSGRFTLGRAGSLTEKIDAKNTLLGLITRVAAGEEVDFTIAPGYSPNPYNLIGKKALDFNAPGVFNKKSVRFKHYIKKDKRPVVLAFWSITCPHCQKTMPVLAKFANSNKKRFRLLTMAVIHKPEYKKMAKVYFKKHKLSFSLLNDKKGKTFNDYRIMTVPTLFVIDPSGVIRNAHLGGGEKVDKALLPMLAELDKKPTLKSPESRKPAPRRPKARPASRPTK